MADLSKIVCLEQDCRHGTEQTGSSGSGNDSYTKAEIDSKDADIRAAASEAKSAANNAQSVNQTQDGQIKALQEAVDNLPNNIGTITGIKMNGVSKGTSGVVDLGTVITKHQDVSGKVNNTLDGANSLLSKITKIYTAAITDNTYFIRKNPGGTDEFGLIKFLTLWEYIKGKIEFLGYTGTITGIKMNGASKGTSGVVDLGAVITAHQDISGKQDKSTAVTHTANTAVGSATKPVYVAADGKAAAISHSINSDVPANAKFTDTVYTHPTTSGNKHIPSGGSSGQILRWSADGTAVWGANLPTTNVGSGSQPQEFRLAATISIKTWSHYHGVYAIGSRHSGTGILVVDVGCENSSVSFANVAAQCICFGASLNNRIQSNTFQIYVSDDGSKAYLFIKNWDYSVCTIKSLRTDGITISNGLAMASIDTSTYGTLKCQTTICGVTFSGTAAKANAITETAWTAVPATGADSTSERDLKYLVMGNTVYVQGYLKFSAGNNNPKCGTLPGGARPNDTLYFTSWDTQSGVPTAFPIVVNEAGIIMLMNPTSTAYWFKAGRAYRFNFSYHIN